jgi:DNA polymerase alpha subunit A
MDPSKYVTAVALPQDDQFISLESLVPDKERFRDADLLIVKCNGCRGSFNFVAVGSPEVRPYSQRDGVDLIATPQ